MEIRDDGIFLSLRRFGEQSAIASVLTPGHGLVRGLVRGATSKTRRGILQPGNLVTIDWKARLAEQLGAMTLDMQRPLAAHLVNDTLALAGLNAATALMETYLVEHEPHRAMHARLMAMLEGALQGGDAWIRHYVQLELMLLAEAGFGLDLGECAMTGTTTALTHVSPKSGRAVCAAVAAPYAGRLLVLPNFLGLGQSQPGQAYPTRPEIIDGLRLTGYFLEAWLAEASGRKLPAARARLLAALDHIAPDHSDAFIQSQFIQSQTVS